MNNLTYSQNGDYLIPDLTVTEPAQPIGKYGRMKKQYLMEHRTPLFHSLLLSEKLFPHPLEIDQTATRRMGADYGRLAESAASSRQDDPSDGMGRSYEQPQSTGRGNDAD